MNRTVATVAKKAQITITTICQSSNYYDSDKKIFHYDGSNTITNNMFSVKYQLFLNDIYFWGATELLTYAMTKTYLEDINFSVQKLNYKPVLV